MSASIKDLVQSLRDVADRIEKELLAPPTLAENPDREVRAGDRVEHPEFGLGTVINVNPKRKQAAQPDKIVRVDFDYAVYGTSHVAWVHPFELRTR